MPGESGGSVLDLAEQPADRWGDFSTRAISSVVLAPIGVLCVWIGGIAFLLAIVCVVLGLAIEWLALCRRQASRPRVAVLCPIGLGYIALAGAAMLWLRDDPAGRANVLFLLFIVWASDIGAYVAGRAIGGRRMAPQISPGKTWSGAAGGLLAALVVGLLGAHLLASTGSAWRAAAVALALGIVAQAGDLLESLVKRQLEVKDSGHIIPGHGGLLDRLDGVLAAAPAAALLALALGRGVVLWQ